MKTLALRRKAPGGFTLLELLVVMVIISILASMTFVVGPKVLLSMRKQSVRGDMQQLEMAILEYYNEYGRYPLANDLQGEDLIIGGDGAAAGTEEMMRVLLAEPLGWNEGNALNPKRIQFITPRPAKGGESAPRNGLGEDGKLYDMWGNEYKIYFDANYDEKLSGAGTQAFIYSDRDIQTTEGAFSGSLMILSVGSDGERGKQSDSGEGGEEGVRYEGSDDVASWL